MSLDNLYSKWYDIHDTRDPKFVLLCWGLLQTVKKTDERQYDHLYDAIRYAMEDCLYDYE